MIKRQLWLLGCLLCWTLPMYAGTRLEARAETLLRSCNASQAIELVRTFRNDVAPAILKELSADELADFMLSQCQDHGGLVLQKILESSPTLLRAIVVGKKTQLGLELLLALNPEGKLEMPVLDPLPLHDFKAPDQLTDERLVQIVQSEVDRLADTGLFSGIVMIARDHRPIVTETRGYAQREKKILITQKSQFTLASLSKLFTAVAAGQLVDEKKLSFDDKVGGFFPAYPNATVRDHATLGMLLAHQAGLGDILDKRPPAMLKNGWKRASEFVPLTAEDPLEFTPGSRQGYSNAGLALAGAIIEKASGLDYPIYLQERIFKPSGMTASDPHNIPFQGPDLVTPYTRHGSSKGWQRATADLGSPAGGAIASASDLVAFADQLRQGRLMSKPRLEQMKAPRSGKDRTHGYGYGMSTERIDGFEWIGHNGGFEGVSTELSLMPDGPYTLVILENRDPPASEWLGTRLRLLLSAKHRQGL